MHGTALQGVNREGAQGDGRLWGHDRKGEKGWALCNKDIFLEAQSDQGPWHHQKKKYTSGYLFSLGRFFYDFLIAVAVMDALNKTSWLSLSIFFCGEAIIAEQSFLHKDCIRPEYIILREELYGEGTE